MREVRSRSFQSRRNEVLAWIDGELEDFSISRSARRAGGDRRLVRRTRELYHRTRLRDRCGSSVASGQGQPRGRMSSSGHYPLPWGLLARHAFFNWFAGPDSDLLCTAMSRQKAARPASLPETQLIPLPWPQSSAVDVLRYDLLRHIVLSVIEHYCDGIIPAPPEGLLEHGRLLRAVAGFSRVSPGISVHSHLTALLMQFGHS